MLRDCEQHRVKDIQEASKTSLVASSYHGISIDWAGSMGKISSSGTSEGWGRRDMVEVSSEARSNPFMAAHQKIIVDEEQFNDQYQKIKDSYNALVKFNDFGDINYLGSLARNAVNEEI